ncbi:MAG: MGMT family protein [Gemmatimonadota bacterium]|nr:MGMT family protein [Gemmatimonadota bacterium]
MTSHPSPAYSAIYAVVRRIPRGRVATYGQVAELAGGRVTARQVGYALHALPASTTVPWHRVVNREGRISLPPESGGIEQQLRLAKEGVHTPPGGRLPLPGHLWRPRQS